MWYVERVRYYKPLSAPHILLKDKVEGVCGVGYLIIKNCPMALQNRKIKI
jgi:hypothetical protein